MSNLTENLLAQYYGFSTEPKTEKFLSIHECANNAENDADKLIGNQSTVDTNDDDTSKETEAQDDNVESEKRNSEDNVPARSSRSLKWEELEDDSETSPGFDVIFEANTAGNSYENTNASCSKEADDVAASNGKIIPVTLGPEDNEGNDSYLSLSEDVSEVSSIADKKKLKASSSAVTSLLAPVPIKTPTYNETFIDLTSAGLKSFPIETIEKYSAIRMLYLENNDLLELPKELFLYLRRLQWLDVRNNRLTSLPTTIKSHPSLETILLQGNKIETLPLELCLVPRLKTLNVADNPIATPPKSIVALGCSSILSYLRAEWNKLHPDEFVTFVEHKIEPKPSTILCYQSPREKRHKLTKIPRRESKSTGDIGDSFKGVSVRKRSRAYRASNRYNNRTRINAILENSINVMGGMKRDDGALCASCAEKFAAVQHAVETDDEQEENESDKTSRTSDERRSNEQHAFLKILTSCHDVKNTCIDKEIAEVDAGLITYKHYRERECKIKAISNETRHIALAKFDKSVAFKEKRKKCKDIRQPELIFDVVTRDMRKLQLRPMQLKDSRSILLCLENYLGISR